MGGDSPRRPLKLFCSYAHEDEDLRQELEKHLSILEENRVIVGWHDRKIVAGEEWKGVIDDNLEAADIILFLVSADFLASPYCRDVEVKRALERHRAREARVIPVIMRPCLWESAPFSHLQAVPTDGKPVVDWKSHDHAFQNVVKAIERMATSLAEKSWKTAENTDGRGRWYGVIVHRKALVFTVLMLGAVVGFLLLTRYNFLTKLGFSETRVVRPFVFLHIDAATRSAWGHPDPTPRDELLCLINYARSSGAALVIVDMDLSAPGQSDRAAAALARYLPHLNGDAPCTAVPGRVDAVSASQVPIILARKIEGTSSCPYSHGEFRPSFLDDVVHRSHNLHWGSVGLCQDRQWFVFAQFVRRWVLWAAACQRKENRETVEFIPSAALVAYILLGRPNAGVDGPDEVVAKLNATCAPSSCDKAPDLFGCGKIKIDHDWLDLSQQVVNVEYAIPWVEHEETEAPRVNWQGKSVSALTPISAYDITRRYCGRGLDSEGPGECSRAPISISGEVNASETLGHGSTQPINILKDRIVIIGRSDPESGDTFATPLGEMPGAVVLINTINTLLQRIHEP